MATTVAAIASGVRSGELSAVDVLDAHLARIDARDDEVHAFNLVTRRRGARAGGRHRRRRRRG
jgi:Asp-tRNA(Asn)/Glu-tRNA(Gln) amidotransferase A subunit family amidase